jgi:hypothetical protein
VTGIVFARLMKSIGDAATAKDGTKEGAILMAIAMGLVAAPCVAGSGARGLVPKVKGWRSAAHGDGCRAWR